MPPDDGNDRTRNTRTYVWAGTVILVVTIIAVVVIVTANKADALSKVVITLAPVIASSVGVVTTAVLNGRIRDDNKHIKSQIHSVSSQVSTVEHQTNGALSPRIETVTRKVLEDPGIQHNIASHLADVLVEKAVPKIVQSSRRHGDPGNQDSPEPPDAA